MHGLICRFPLCLSINEANISAERLELLCEPRKRGVVEGQARHAHIITVRRGKGRAVRTHCLLELLALFAQ
jgi:hypothetical protein